MDNEIWKPVVSINGYLEVSDKGRFRNPKTGRILKLQVSPGGYYNVTCIPYGKYGKTVCLFLHRQLAIAFIPNPDNLPIINHKDCNKLNNSLDNLEWCNHSHNGLHASKNGLLKKHMPEYVLSTAAVEDIRTNCRPSCYKNGLRAFGRKYRVSYATVRTAYYNMAYKGYPIV